LEFLLSTDEFQLEETTTNELPDFRIIENSNSSKIKPSDERFRDVKLRYRSKLHKGPLNVVGTCSYPSFFLTDNRNVLNFSFKASAERVAPNRYQQIV
jgi:hypothetical protein